MANDRVDEFLDLYKKLEQLLKVYYSNDSGRYDSVVARFENSREDQRQICRGTFPRNHGCPAGNDPHDRTSEDGDRFRCKNRSDL